jgi:hypothetical protein
MTERYEDPATRAGRPISTGEFRATPDASASTAQFRAFAETEGEPGRPWDMGAPGRNVAKMALIVVIVAVVLAAIAIAVLG